MFYRGLLRRALRRGSPEDLQALGDWFERYGDVYWNGEYFDADGYRLFPIYEMIDDDFFIVGYEFK